MRIKSTVTQPVAPDSEVFMSAGVELDIHPGYVVPSWLKPAGMAVTETLDQEARDAFWREYGRAIAVQVSSGRNYSLA